MSDRPLTFAEQVAARGLHKGAMANRNMTATPMDRLVDPTWTPNPQPKPGQWVIPDFADYPVPQAAQFRWWFSRMAPVAPPWRVRISASLAFRYSMAVISQALAPVASIMMTPDGRHPMPQRYPESVEGPIQFEYDDQEHRPAPSNPALWLPDGVERTR